MEIKRVCVLGGSGFSSGVTRFAHYLTLKPWGI